LIFYLYLGIAFLIIVFKSNLISIFLDKLQPTEVVKSVRPKFNSLLFFEVSDRSFHQVAEVLSESKCRLSINGWFHGKINKRPLRHVDQIPEPMTFKDIDVNLKLFHFKSKISNFYKKMKSNLNSQTYFLIGLSKST